MAAKRPGGPQPQVAEAAGRAGRSSRRCSESPRRRPPRPGSGVRSGGCSRTPATGARRTSPPRRPTARSCSSRPPPAAHSRSPDVRRWAGSPLAPRLASGWPAGWPPSAGQRPTDGAARSSSRCSARSRRDAVCAGSGAAALGHVLPNGSSSAALITCSSSGEPAGTADPPLTRRVARPVDHRPRGLDPEHRRSARCPPAASIGDRVSATDSSVLSKMAKTSGGLDHRLGARRRASSLRVRTSSPRSPAGTDPRRGRAQSARPMIGSRGSRTA